MAWRDSHSPNQFTTQCACKRKPWKSGHFHGRVSSGGREKRAAARRRPQGQIHFALPNAALKSRSSTAHFPSISFTVGERLAPQTCLHSHTICFGTTRTT